ncbi:cytochrome C [Novosphingobium sp. SG720]|uniref:SorB family sulfite dehydrogenase c-type cytochrome subunit n=1 Tax=Novosphingobium sp. SG720 TaxID=2586998 RepID=UPI00179C11E9|nr:cytochrome C [Novosphingobium sp. SG720]NKJ43099.1 mono/diheme cytochrome c family protein [Novosphingobium sp. SG720]
MMRRLGIAALAVAALVTLCAATYRLPPEPTVRLGTGSEAELAEAHCAACHSLDYIVNQPPGMGIAFWTAEVAKMRTVYGAAIDDETAKRIATYLAERKGT